MPGNRGGQSKRKDGKLADQFREVCPQHKLKDLDQLVKNLKGDEKKINEKIQEWWDEPQTVAEPEWEAVDQKSSKKKKQPPQQQSGRGSRGPRSGGRGLREGRSPAGGRGSGGERGDRNRGGRRSPQSTKTSSPPKQEAAPPPTAATNGPGPAPVVNVPAPKGAWGQHQQPQPKEPVAKEPTPTPTPAKQAVPIAQEKPVKKSSLGLVTSNDPMPSGLVAQPPAAAPPRPSGNVWATKGSAHLIQASKPSPARAFPEQLAESKPKPSFPEQLAESKPKPSPPRKEAENLVAPPSPAAAESLDGLPPSITGANVNATGWKPQSPVQPSPVLSPAVVPPPPPPEIPIEPLVASPQTKPPVAPVETKPAGPTNVLNMGHWGDTGDGDEGSHSLDFGFGSFGPENDVASVDETTTSTMTGNNNNTSLQTEVPKEAPPGVSPARPPPGLSIGGGGVMPPMPANAVLVHELENKLESANLKDQEPKPPTQSNAPPPNVQQQQPGQAPGLPQTTTPQNYNAGYGMGMYNQYNAAAASGGFAGMPAPLSGVPPQHPKPTPAQQQQSGISGQQTSAGTAPQHLQQQQGGLYGAAATAGSTPGGTETTTSTDAAGATTAPAGIPPGMPGTMPYNPALFYGQQPYQMGQPHGGVGYGYGYAGQFGGAVQGGFAGYGQVMGQSGAYGQPYDDHPPQQQHGSHGGSHHSGSQGGYQNKSHAGGGGYRGRNSHHNNSQYQSQYNPQQHGGGYGQPYAGMGYGVDHFNQRGYGGPGTMDPYAMNSSGYSQGHGSGFAGQEDGDGHGKGKKGGNGNRTNNNNGGSNPNLQQFQQHAPPQQLAGGQAGQQQSFGLQGGPGGATDTTTATGGSNAGWSNNQGWGGPSWQQGA